MNVPKLELTDEFWLTLNKPHSKQWNKAHTDQGNKAHIKQGSHYIRLKLWMDKTQILRSLRSINYELSWSDEAQKALKLGLEN